MRFKKLDLNLLVALDHMLESRSVTAAADKMFMSQSAMSNALTRLRSYFDDPLLVQVGRRMELTPRAESLRPAIRDILVRTEAAIDTQPRFDPQASDRVFNILLSDYSLRVLMPHVFALAAEQKARVGFNLRAQTMTPHLQLDQGAMDLLIVPNDFTSADHPSAPLYQDRYVACAWRDGKYGVAPLGKADYEEAGHIAMVPPNDAPSVDGQRLADAGLTRRIEVTSFSFSTLPYLIAGTDRLATVHGLIAHTMRDRDDLVFHPIPVDTAPLQQAMQWHTYRETDPGILWLRALFTEAAARLPDHSWLECM